MIITGVDIQWCIYEPSKLNIYIDHRQKSIRHTKEDAEGYAELDVVQSEEILSEQYPEEQQLSITAKI